LHAVDADEPSEHTVTADNHTSICQLHVTPDDNDLRQGYFTRVITPEIRHCADVEEPIAKRELIERTEGSKVGPPDVRGLVNRHAHSDKALMVGNRKLAELTHRLLFDFAKPRELRSTAIGVSDVDRE